MARYGNQARKSVKGAMEKMKEGRLKSGGSGKKVRNPKQAVAIGLSEARRKGAKVPPAPASKRRRATGPGTATGKRKSAKS